MGLYKRILVPTDGSDGMERVVAHAAEIAAVHGATIHVVYVVNTASYAGLPMETSWEGIDEMLRRDAEASVEAARRIAEARGVPVETRVVKGSPSREIVEYTEREGCDLVVMGTHGRGGIDRLLLGSVAETVVRGSSVPVLTVRVGDDAVVDVDADAGDAATDGADAESGNTPEG